VVVDCDRQACREPADPVMAFLALSTAARATGAGAAGPFDRPKEHGDIGRDEPSRLELVARQGTLVEVCRRRLERDEWPLSPPDQASQAPGLRVVGRQA